VEKADFEDIEYTLIGESQNADSASAAEKSSSHWSSSGFRCMEGGSIMTNHVSKVREVLFELCEQKGFVDPVTNLRPASEEGLSALLATYQVQSGYMGNTLFQGHG
jgi:hypothetical protein